MTGGRAERMEELIRIFREKTQRGISILEAEPDTPERADKQFQARRKIVQEVVAEVEVQPDRNIVIYTEFDLPSVCWPDDNHSNGTLGKRGIGKDGGRNVLL